MYAREVATAQLLEDGEVASLRCRNGDGIENADEFELARHDGVGDALDDRGVSVVKDLSSSAVLNQVVVVGTSDSDDFDFRGHKDLNRHGTDGRRSAVHDEGLAGRRCSGW